MVAIVPAMGSFRECSHEVCDAGTILKAVLPAKPPVDPGLTQLVASSSLLLDIFVDPSTNFYASFQVKYVCSETHPVPLASGDF